jgi:putrescine transport system substrate-binding protein
MLSTFRILGLGAYLALVILGCSERSKPPPERAPDLSAQNAASGTPTTDPEKVLNVYNWSDHFGPSVIQEFEKEYGIRVNYDFFDSEELLETKLLTGHTNYDVVFPDGSFLGRQIKAGVYQKLDKPLLPNLKNLDPAVLLAEAVNDPGNEYAIDYLWLITTGIGYDVAKIKARMADAPVDSWRMFYDPTVLAKFQDCGVAVLDSPLDVVSTVFAFLGKDPNSESSADLKAAEQVMLSIRPYVRMIDSRRLDDALANGDICLALGWSGQMTRARDRASEARQGAQIAFSIPKEGTITTSDTIAIPADAPHPRNAHLFINYLLRPEVAAKNTNLIRYANPVVASAALVAPELLNDPAIYPQPDARARLTPLRAKSLEFTRQMMRTWTRFKTGQ